MDALVQDLRFAVRQLVRSPGFATVAALTLALGIGANTAIFSVVNGVVLRPLPFHEPDRLVAFVDAGAYKGMLLEYRERARSFEGVEGYSSYGFDVSLTGDGEPARVESAAVTAGLFSLLGVEPALGRTFLPEEEWTGSHRVVLLAHGFWRDRYGADPEIVGRTIRLDGTAHEVVGVMPEGFGFPTARARLWVPFGIDRGDRFDLWAATAGTFVARLGPDATVQQAAAEVAAVAPALRELFPWQLPADFWEGATVVPLQDRLVGDVRPALLVLLGAVGLVLLVACANVASLLLARAAARRREIAIRAAIGAGRGRLVRQVLTESLVLAAFAGGAGLLLALWGVELLVAGLPAETPRLHEIGIDARVLAVAAGLTVATGLLFGSLPALRASGGRLSGDLRDGERTGRSAGQRRLAGGLVVAEIALAVVLVTGATLLARSFLEVTRIDPGFHTEGLVTATVAPPGFRYADAPARRAFHEALLRRVAALPGVEGVAATTRLPFGSGSWGSVFLIEGRPDPATEGGDWPYAEIDAVVSDGYFREMGIPLLEGRRFGPEDRADAPPVAIVNRSLALQYWPDESPVGRRIRAPGGEWRTIVGVVADTRVRGLVGERDTGVYRPLGQGDAEVLSLAIRTETEPGALAPLLRETVRALDAETPLEDVRGMAQLVSASVAERRFTMVLLGAFAAVALLLGAIGTYGLLAHAVNDRRREIGLRMALGARAEDVLRWVVGRGALLAGFGIAIGTGAALLAGRALAGLLYGVGTADPATFLSVPLVLLGVACLAAWLPARRAARVDPAVALRGE